MTRIQIKPEFQEELVRLREKKLLILGILIGIVGNLLANIVDTWVKPGEAYPLWYVIVVFVLFIVIILVTLKLYFKLKFMLFKGRRLLKKIEKYN